MCKLFIRLKVDILVVCIDSSSCKNADINRQQIFTFYAVWTHSMKQPALLLRDGVTCPTLLFDQFYRNNPSGILKDPRSYRF